MASTILVTKLFIPATRPELVPRPRLIERLNGGLHRKLTLISAPAGFGKTTVVTEWLDSLRGDSQQEEPTKNRITWLSLDEGDNDPTRFQTYFIAALNQIEGMDTTFGEGSLMMLQSPQPPPIEAVLTPLINEIAGLTGAALSDRIIFVLDDYHLIDTQPIQDILSFLLENKPPQLHLVIATREDPLLQLSRLRARSQLTELRAADLRFTFSEAADFLNQVMGLHLSNEDIAALETRTEGWIAGLQLAAISLQGHKDAPDLIKSFTGSHRLVLDYLIEEVLVQQTEDIQTFLLQTAILNQMTGSLCDALTGKNNGQQTLEYLEQVNLFIVSLDEERRWYRYHHLFADLLRQRLHQRTASSKGDEGGSVAEYHIRASVWYENNGLEIEAFQHAVSANDVEQAARLVEGDGGMPLHYRGAVTPILNWLESLPTAELDVRPSLWVMYASVLMFTGQTGVEEKLQAAESALADTAALGGADLDAKTRDLVGHIAATRAMLAVPQHQVETIIAQSHHALKFLHPDNLPVRTATNWALGWAYQLQGDRTAAKQAFVEVISIGQASGNTLFTIGATTSVGQLQEAENQLYQAAETYRSVLQMAGDHPLPVACEAHLGLAHVFYEWNDVDAAQEHGKRSVQFARQLENTGSFIPCEVFLARLKLTLGNDVTGAATILAEVEQGMRQHDFVHRMPEVAAVQVLTFIRQGNLVAAAHLANKHELPISQARVHLAQGDSSAALAMLEPYRRQMEKKDWADERLKVMVLQAVAHYAHGEGDKAAQLLGDALALAEPGGFIRIFVDEGSPMARLLYEALSRGIAPDYVQRLLAAFPDAEPEHATTSQKRTSESEWVEPLSERELDVLQLVAEGLTNQEIASRLYLSLNTVKAHTRSIYSKLSVNSRTRATARARSLGILNST